MAQSLAAQERQFIWSAGAAAFMNRHHFTLMLYQLSHRNRLVPMLHLHNDGGLTRDIKKLVVRVVAVQPEMSWL